MIHQEKSLNQNSQFETKSFTELVIEHLMKFEWEIDKYFPSLGKDEIAFIRIPFTANARILQAGTEEEEQVKLQHNSFSRDVYSEKNLCEFLMF